MSAVSQSYPNYLGGLNEQPDELKKPGQLVEALNVIPDPTIGLTRRPGFELVASDLPDVDPRGTWFEVELANQVNQDYIYFGCVNRDGSVKIFNQDGVEQIVRYTDDSVIPHKSYEYDDGDLLTIDDNDDEIDTSVTTLSKLGYFKHDEETPLKYCVSKDNIVFTNPISVPRLAVAKKPGTLANNDNHTTRERDKNYYSFINLKLVDTENYDYTFRRFYADDNTVRYSYIQDIDLTKVDDIDADYDKDTSLPLQTEGPFLFNLNSDTSTEDAVVEVTFKGQVVQLKSEDGDGFRNEARYSWSVRLIVPGKGFEKGQIIRRTLDGQPDGGNNPDLTLTFKVTKVNKITATKNDHIVPTVPAGSTAEEILDLLRDEFLNVGIDKAVIVGTGLYLENKQEFSVSTSELAVADVINSQKEEDDIVPIVRVNSVAELPTECYSGFLVQVSNSFNNENDYYLEYKSESNSIQEGEDLDLTKSDGYWEEVARPFEQYNPVNGTLPHMITVARDVTPPADGEEPKTNFVFVVSPIAFESRTAGTAKDNPSMFVDSSPISEVNYYKNRLFFLTRIGTVITSRAAEINNLFLNTAISISVIDPIDVVANSNQRVPIHGSAVVNNAMVLFGDTEQYSVNTSNDVLTSETVNVTKVSNYTFDPVSQPTYLGTNLCFISKGLTRFYEMTNIYDRGPVDINERSQQIQTQFGQGFNMPVSSREQSMVIVYKRYKRNQNVDRSSSMYMYRFRQESSQESSQSAWVRWQVPHPVAYVSLPDDKMFVFVVELVPGGENKVHLYKMDSSVLEGLPATGNSLSVVPKYRDGWTQDEPGSGEQFETRITFPTIYLRGKEAYDVTSNTTIHRVKMSTAAIGTYNLEIKRKGYDTYNILVEQTPADEYRSEFPPLYGEHIETVPIYTRNKNLTLTMSTDFDAPLTLRSMTWEGDYNRPFYKSV